MQVIESLTYIGRNRRSNKCVIENLVELTPCELQAFSVGPEEIDKKIRSALQSNGIPVTGNVPSCKVPKGDAMGLFASFYANATLHIQRAVGHEVSFSTEIKDSNPTRTRVVFEYEHADVGHFADGLALNLLTEVIPAFSWTGRPSEQTDRFPELFVKFREFAQPLRLPKDTQVIIDAAALLDVPCVKLEREPYEGLVGDFRIRKNGLLKLGHSVYQHIVDGTLCIDKCTHLLPLLKDREQLFQRLSQLQVPVAQQDHEFRNCVNAQRAERSASSVGYPVVVKPWLRDTDQNITLNIPDVDSLRIAVQKAQRHSRRIMVEKHIPGDTYKIIVANGEVIGVVSMADGEDVCGETHFSTIDLVVDLASQMNTGLLVVDVVTTEIGKPLQQCGGAVVDVELAPELDRFLPGESDLHKRAMSAFVRWLYPQGARSRIPTIAVTGTNGKTTTSRMIARVMQTENFHTGFACTDGIYINEKLREAGDRAGSGGHHRLFESREVDLGVLETARGALAHSGFMFDWCNVSVCLNVTADHLGQYGIETLDQMAELKRSVLESARDAVVLNADDGYCVGMLPFLSAPRVCLVSMQSAISELAKIPGNTSCFSVLESIDATAWLVLYDGGKRLPVMEAGRIPATFGGLAKFNVCNALHAVAACYLMGANLDAIRDALGGFGMSFDSTPGRLNFYHGHPFTVIMDYAHNVDGISKLCAFVDELQCSGRKLLMYQGRGDVEDVWIKRFAAGPAHHFDHYVCRTHPKYTGPDDQKVLALMKQALMESGVKENQITTTTDTAFAVETMLMMGQKGDLLVFAPGAGQRQDTWHQIISFESG